MKRRVTIGPNGREFVGVDLSAVAGPATPETEAGDRTNAELEERIRRIGREEIKAAATPKYDRQATALEHAKIVRQRARDGGPYAR